MSRQPGSWWKWWVCGALLLATLLNYMDRQALPQTATELKQLYHLDDARYGWIEASFAWAFAAGSVLFGLLADRFGPRRLYPLVLTGWSAAGLLTPLAGQPDLTAPLAGPTADPGAGPYRWLLICRIALGLFEAGHWPCALLTARAVLTAAERPLGNGLLQSGASLGAILIPVYVMAVRNLGGGWEVVFWSIGAAGLLWVPVWVALTRGADLASGGRQPPVDCYQQGADAPRSPHLLVRLLTLLIVVSCLNVSWQFLRAWLPKFLKESQGYSADATDWAVVGYYVAADAGAILAGVLVSVLTARGWAVHRARLTGFALFAGLTTAAAAIPLAGPGPHVFALLMLAGAGILGLHPYYYALVQELPAKRMGALSGGLAAVGWVVNGTFQASVGEHIKATQSYDLGLTIAGLAPLVGLMVLLALWRR